MTNRITISNRAGTLLNRSNASPLFILGASLLLSLLYCPPVDIYFDDKEIFGYIGRLISKGGVPYRDVFDHKPPLIYFFNYFGPWGLWLIDAFLTGLASLLFFRLCQKYRLAWPWLLPLLFNLLVRNYLVCISIGMTREYTATFALIFFCILLNGSKYRYFWLGLLTAATFFMQQDQIVLLFPFWLYALLIDILPGRPGSEPHVPSTSAAPASGAPGQSPVRQILLALAGAIALSAPIILYFSLNHSLSWFWQCAFQFNFLWYDEKIPFFVHFRATKAALEYSAIMVTFLLAVAAGFCALALRSDNRRLIAIALVAVFLSFTSEYLSGRLRFGYAFYYYLLPLASTLPILVFAVWATTREEFLLGKKSQGFYGLLLCCLPFYTAFQHGTHLSTHNKDLEKSMPEYIWLRQQQLKDYELFSFGNNDWLYVYNQLNILAPSRWVYQHIWESYPRWDADHREMESIMNDLLRHHTKYIINDLRLFRWRDPSARTLWLTFLQKNYQPLTPLLWQLK